MLTIENATSQNVEPQILRKRDRQVRHETESCCNIWWRASRKKLVLSITDLETHGIVSSSMHFGPLILIPDGSMTGQ